MIVVFITEKRNLQLSSDIAYDCSQKRDKRNSEWNEKIETKGNENNKIARPLNWFTTNTFSF